MLGIAVVLVGCGGGPEGDPVEQDGEVAVEPTESDDPLATDDTLPSPAQLTAPIGVVYETSGSFDDTFGLIQTPDVSSSPTTG